ncbi:hypothetical protein Fot_37347 [Forsythia ovata]|uniref:Uncharacterized protein n=1 Tax=Forsythia ovata TaxID=205694 RepID=A0ABD1RYT0_9LAMI
MYVYLVKSCTPRRRGGGAPARGGSQVSCFQTTMVVKQLDNQPSWLSSCSTTIMVFEQVEQLDNHGWLSSNGFRVARQPYHGWLSSCSTTMMVVELIRQGISGCSEGF